MPRTNPKSYYLPEKEKAFVFTQLSLLAATLRLKPSRRDLIKLALKFPPGSSPVRLQDWERKVIVSWLLKLHKLAEARGKFEHMGRLRAILELL